MKRDEAVQIVRPHLTDTRFEHTIRVAETAVALAGIYQVSLASAELAAIFHDFAKYRPLEKMEEDIRKSESLPNDLLDYHPEVWHGPVGAMLAASEHGIADEDILNAIRYHTTGRAGMSDLEKVIFLADYIEPGRQIPGIDEVRKAAETNLDYACFLVSRNTISYLMSKNATIYPDSFLAFNDLTRQINGGN